jgi:hypothetical protein
MVHRRIQQADCPFVRVNRLLACVEYACERIQAYLLEKSKSRAFSLPVEEPITTTAMPIVKNIFLVSVVGTPCVKVNYFSNFWIKVLLNQILHHNECIMLGESQILALKG